MRHVRSILYALVLAPAVWALCGVGFTGDLIGRLPLLLAGAAYAILIFAPISPAGPMLGGLAFLGVGLWALAAPSSYADGWTPNLTSNGFDLSLPGYGLALLLAVPMICTGLSARRWAEYEPPVLPLIGPLGRARGAAAVAGTPVSVAETEVLVAPGARRAAAERVPLSDNGDEATTLLSTTAPAAASFAVSSDGATTALPAWPGGGVPNGPTAEDEPGEATDALEEGPTEAVVTEPIAAPEIAAPEEEPAEAVTEAVITQAVVVDDDKVVFAGGDEDGEERTQLLRLPGDGEVTRAQAQPSTDDVRIDERPTADIHQERPTEDVRAAAERPTDDFDLGRPTRDFGPGEKTQVIARNPGEATQVIRRTGAIYPPPGETTRSIQPTWAVVEPSAERTQVIKLPTTPAAPPSSIVGAERPDPYSDPTTRLLPLPGSEETTAEQKNWETTARSAGEAGTAERPMTVLNMERPSDEAEEDTHRLTVPNQRRPRDG